MKARLSKPKNLEQDTPSIVDQVNEFYLNKTFSSDSNTMFANFKSKLDQQVPTNVKLAVAYLSGGVSKGMKSRVSNSSSNNPLSGYTFNLKSNSTNLGSITGVNQLNAVTESSVAKPTTASIANSKYLQIKALTKKSTGELADRYAAINKKVETNIRLLQTEDYKVFQKIKRVQNIGGTSLTLSVPAFFMTVFAKGLTNSVKLNLMKSAFMFMFMTGGVLGHYTWKYSKFLDHLDKKYFYAASINDLQDSQLIKTNLPKNLHFENSEWSLKDKILSPKGDQRKSSKKDYL